MNEERRRFRYFGPDDELTPLAQAIMDEDIPYLENSLGKDWLLNKPFQYCEHCTGLAIQLALVESRYRVVDYLLSNEADLNVPNSPAIVSAVSSLDTELIDRIINAGANLFSKNNVGYDALDQAVAWKHYELIPFLENKGLDIGNHKGPMFDLAVSSGNLSFVEELLKKGANPNRNSSRNQGGTGETPLHTAVLYRNFKMVKLLVRYGADPTRTDIHGQRPLHWAMGVDEERAQEMAEYLRSLEPAAMHDASVKLKLAKRYRIPPGLIAFLERGDRQLVTKQGQNVADLLSLNDLYEFHWMKRKFLAISRLVHDDFSCGEIVWCKKRRAICIIDIEHDELFDVGPWQEFNTRPEMAIEQIWGGMINPE